MKSTNNVLPRELLSLLRLQNGKGLLRGEEINKDSYIIKTQQFEVNSRTICRKLGKLKNIHSRQFGLCELPPGSSAGPYFFLLICLWSTSFMQSGRFESIQEFCMVSVSPRWFGYLKPLLGKLTSQSLTVVITADVCLEEGGQWIWSASLAFWSQ